MSPSKTFTSSPPAKLVKKMHFHNTRMVCGGLDVYPLDFRIGAMLKTIITRQYQHEN